jgi:(p)ppGpp synthase/HD superfamily hydrolase
MWLCDCVVATYIDNQHVDLDQKLIAKAFELAAQAHEGQTRRSGEPYIMHPVAVADLLHDLGPLDSDCQDATLIAAALLHDTIEDTQVSGEYIQLEFGEEVRRLVDGVTKLATDNLSKPRHNRTEVGLMKCTPHPNVVFLSTTRALAPISISVCLHAPAYVYTLYINLGAIRIYTIY